MTGLSIEETKEAEEDEGLYEQTVWGLTDDSGHAEQREEGADARPRARAERGVDVVAPRLEPNHRLVQLFLRRVWVLRPR